MKITLERAVRNVDELDLDLVATHLTVLQERGLYERALLNAYVNTNHAHWAQAEIIFLFRLANPARLRRLGDGLNRSGLLTLFQGRSARCAAGSCGVPRLSLGGYVTGTGVTSGVLAAGGR